MRASSLSRRTLGPAFVITAQDDVDPYRSDYRVLVVQAADSAGRYDATAAIIRDTSIAIQRKEEHEIDCNSRLGIIDTVSFPSKLQPPGHELGCKR